MKIRYNIAGLKVDFYDYAGVQMINAFEPFEVESDDTPPDHSIYLYPYDRDELPVPPEEEMELVFDDTINTLYASGDNLIKRTGMREGDPRVMWTIMNKVDYARADVYIPSDFLDYGGYANAFMFEKMLLAHDAVMLHCSLIETNGKGVAFTAPSQTGKSTQARLWETHRGARIINGDRAIMRLVNEGIYAYGSPWAGSSGIFVNEGIRLNAIVALEQAKDNKVRKLTNTEALNFFLIGTSLPMWDEALLDKGLAVIERILTETNLLMLSCTPDERAVRALEDSLKDALPHAD
ncbi:hypothetical protein FACS18948_2530 [Clostridia bacterium]|nr:hypothetical protein FACS18948_2530 [Clostridia bacterium]